jgi:hypothetical protein
MRLTYWEMSYGAQEEPVVQSFYEYLDFAIGEVEFRLEDWKKSAKKEKAPASKAKAKPKPKPAEKRSARKPSK